jgi:hypothetical protein
MKTYLATYVAVKTVETSTDKDGNQTQETSIRVIPEKKFDKENTELSEAGKPIIEASAKQSFQCFEAETPEEALALVDGNEKEFLNLFLRGYDLKVQQGIRETMSEDDFAPVDGAYDTHALGAEERQRRTGDPLARALKGQLKNLGADQQAALLAQIQALLAQAQQPTV